jgi:cytochrome c oxidase cbb3-type subunit 1
MDSYVRNMIRSSLVWLGVGVLIGISMAIWPAGHILYKPGHAHANLLGFVSMMIFGVAYHVLPRFSGRALHSITLAKTHVWVANAGLALQVLGFLLRPHWREIGMAGVGAGGVISAVGAFMFIYNIWRTIGEHHPIALHPPIFKRKAS